MSQLPWVLYTDQSLEQGRFLGKLEWVSMYPLCIRAGMGVYVSANDVSERSCSLF